MGIGASDICVERSGLIDCRWAQGTIEEHHETTQSAKIEYVFAAVPTDQASVT
jgi:hypothetical protein